MYVINNLSVQTCSAFFFLEKPNKLPNVPISYAQQIRQLALRCVRMDR